MEPTSSQPRLQWPDKASALAQAGMAAPLLSVEEHVGSISSGAGFTNRLIFGDNLASLAALAGDPIRQEIEATGGIRLIYLDPPFATGDQFHMDVLIGDPATKLRLPAYRDAWQGGLSGYLSMLAPRLQRLYGLLAEDGSLYFHCDFRAAPHARLLLDEIFGPNRLLNEIVWTYGLGNANTQRAFGRKHDTILLYTKSDNYIFNRLRGPVTPAMAAKYRHTRPDGTRFMRSYGKEYDLQGGKPIGSVWDIPAVAATSKERVGYPTQKPQALLKRIIEASSNPGDLVLDPFCGAGTTLAAANRLDRRWIGCDAGELAIWTSRKRLAGGSSFDLLTLDGEDPPPSLPISYTLSLSFSVIESKNGPCIRLEGIDVEGTAPSGAAPPRGSHLAIDNGVVIRYVPNGEGTRRREVVTGHWSDWLDGWATGTGGLGDEPFTALWETARTRDQRALPLISAPLPHLGGRCDAVTIRVTDFSGRAWTTIASLNGHNQQHGKGNHYGSGLADPRR